MSRLALAASVAVLLGGGLVLWIDWCMYRWDPPRDDEIEADLFQGGPERPRTGRM